MNITIKEVRRTMKLHELSPNEGSTSTRKREDAVLVAVSAKRPVAVIKGKTLVPAVVFVPVSRVVKTHFTVGSEARI